MRPDLAALITAQHGVFTRAQAVEAGYTAREIRSLTREHGTWVVVRRGVYTTRALWEAADPYDGQMALRDAAVHLTTPVMHVFSHDSAARAWGLAIFRPREQYVHLTRPVFTGSRSEHGVKHHLARIQPGEIETVNGLPVTSLVRTALDLARAHGPMTGVTACDSAARLGVSAQDFADALKLMVSWPGVQTARACAAFADPGAQTVGESLTAQLLSEAGLGPRHTQFPVRVGLGTAWVDIRVGRHLIEFDGREKYLDGYGNPSDTVWEEKVRESRMVDEEFVVSRVIWPDLLGRRARAAAIERLLRNHARSIRLYGAHLTAQQQEYAALMAAERQRRIARFRRRDAA